MDHIYSWLSEFNVNNLHHPPSVEPTRVFIETCQAFFKNILGFFVWNVYRKTQRDKSWFETLSGDWTAVQWWPETFVPILSVGNIWAVCRGPSWRSSVTTSLTYQEHLNFTLALISQDKTMVTHHYFIQAGTRAASTHSFSTRNITAKSSDANLETIWELCNEPEVKTVWLGVGGDGGTFTGGFLTIYVSDLIYFFLCWKWCN